MTKDNNLLGKFELSSIPPAPRGVPQIEVTFEIDANGIMKVGAADKGTGKSESITITNEKGRLSQEEIDRMVAEAEKFASEDEAQRKRIEALNALSSFVYGLKNQLGDQEGLGGKISDDDKKTILATVKDTTDWIEENGSSASTEDLEEKLAGAFFSFLLFFCLNVLLTLSFFSFFLQRCKPLLTQSLLNSTLEEDPLLLPMMTTRWAVTTMSCKNPKSFLLIPTYHYIGGKTLGGLMGLAADDRDLEDGFLTIRLFVVFCLKWFHSEVVFFVLDYVSAGST